MRLSRTVTAIVIGTGFAAAQVLGQGKNEPIKTTPCELMKHPEPYNGKMVQVRGMVRTGFETQTLSEENCDAYIWLFWQSGTYNKAEEEYEVAYAYINTRSETRHPEKLDWKPVEGRQPVTLLKDEAFRTLGDYAGRFYGPKGVKGRCHDSPISCPAFAVEATLTGRFDYRELKLRAIRVKDHPGEAYWSPGGFGHLHSFTSQLAVESVSLVAAKPIDRSVYEKKR